MLQLRSSTGKKNQHVDMIWHHNKSIHFRSGKMLWNFRNSLLHNFSKFI